MIPVLRLTDEERKELSEKVKKANGGNGAGHR